MQTDLVLDSIRQAIVTAAVLLGPAVIVALLVGVFMSLLQAITQVQDQAISFVPKLVVVGLVLLLLMPWMTEYYVEYARATFVGIPETVFGR